MTASPDLFDLIKSLSKTEKKYILGLLRGFGESNYLKLFTAIDQQLTYNEPEIKQRFSSEMFAKQLTFTKNYLYNLILKHLRSYYKESSLEVNIHNKLADIEILMQKGFLKQAFKRLKSIQQRTENLDLFQLQLLTRAIEKRMYMLGLYDINLEKTLKEETKNLKLLENVVQIESDGLELYSNQMKFGMKHQDELTRQLTKRIFNKKSPPLSTTAKILRLRSLTIILGNRGIFNSTFWNALKEVDQLFNKDEKFKKANPLMYLSHLKNLAVAKVKQHDLSGGLAMLTQIENWGKSKDLLLTEAVRFKLFESTAILKLECLLKLKRFKEVFDSLPEVVKQIRQFKGGIAKKDLVLKSLFVVSFCYYCNGQHNKAIRLLNEIVNEKTNVAYDVKSYSIILLLICHFELRNFQAFTYVARFRKESARPKWAERVIIDFFLTELSEPLNKAETKIRLLILKNKLIKNAHYKKSQEAFFDIVKWIECRLVGKLYIDTIE